MRKIVVGISGASGIPVAVEVLRLLKEQKEVETHLVISQSGRVTIKYESDWSVEYIESMADVVYSNDAIGSTIASGSFQTEGMVVVPCSMKTVAGIASGYSDSLLLRAADVILKERRKLVLMVRECPLNSIHLRNMKTLCDIGVDIYPLVMTFYNKPKTIEDMVHHLACKCLERFGIEPPEYKRWTPEKTYVKDWEGKEYENVN